MGLAKMFGGRMGRVFHRAPLWFSTGLVSNGVARKLRQIRLGVICVRQMKSSITKR